MAHVRPAHAGNSPPEPAALRADQWGGDLVAETLAQGRTKIADAIGKPEFQGFLSGPIFARKQCLLWAGEDSAAARFYQGDETLMDFPLDRLEPLDVLGFLGE